VALVGATGAGKSTVISLLQRLYEIDDGAVRVDGVDVRDLPREALRQRFVVVPQDVVLFPGDVLRNVALGDPSPDACGREVVDAVGLGALLDRRGAGIDTPVGDRGSNFSVGERQLIALARALYRDPEILVLDEATSSMDSESEALVQRPSRAPSRGAPPSSSRTGCPPSAAPTRSWCFTAGVVAERGTHDALLASGGIYARLHRLQFAEAEGPTTSGSAAAAE
jgi:ATP-binding cassette subfamily B multidrug efflux pump